MNYQFSERVFPTKEDAIEAQAFVDLHRLSPRPFREDQQFECLPIKGGCAISLPDAPAIGLNRILGLGTVELLDEAYGWMRQKSGKQFLQINVDAVPGEVRDWIRARDLQEHGPGWAKLTCNAPSNSLDSPDRIQTRRVTVDEAALFGRMMCEGFNFPASLTCLWAAIVGQDGWSCFFALDNDTPIGTGVMFVSGGWAWLGGGTTRPEFRNRGVQKALIRARRDDGIAKGVSRFVVETEAPSSGKPNISYENLRKMGFEHLYDRKNFRL